MRKYEVLTASLADYSRMIAIATIGDALLDCGEDRCRTCEMNTGEVWIGKAGF